MPSPFPGMDPYLENPRLWPDVHHRIIAIASDLLTSQLRPKYYMRIEDRIYLIDEKDPGRSVIIPDLRVVDNPAFAGQTFEPGVTGTLTVAEPIEVTTLLENEIHESRLEVIDAEKQDVVTVIEVLSPSNKVPGSRGEQSYLEKRQDVMNSPSHWVEIDLLREGSPFVCREPLPACDYLVHVSRANRRPKGTVWPIRLNQKLPVIPIPLRNSDPDGKLDLQSVLATLYDRAAYDLQINYNEEPEPPLTGDKKVWADRLLRENGTRTAKS